jgi:hypothetical protein
MTLIDESLRGLVQRVASQLVFGGQRRASGGHAIGDTRQHDRQPHDSHRTIACGVAFDGRRLIPRTR